MRHSNIPKALTYPIENLPPALEMASRPSWDRVIRVAEQIRLIGTGRTQFYELSKDPNFPPEIILGKRARGRWLSEMVAYIDSRKHRVPTAINEQEHTCVQLSIEKASIGGAE
jgi:predicted DNA-binding transcriptional regulator AlpA